MSIAVSALVKPSRAVRGVLGAGGLALLAAALAVGWGAPERFVLAPVQALALAVSGALLLASAMHTANMHRIDISGIGALRVTVKQDVDAAADAQSEGSAPAAAQRLLPGSVVWPVLIVLRYAAPGARAATLLIGKDSVDAATWRALAVALTVLGRATTGAPETATR